MRVFIVLLVVVTTSSSRASIPDSLRHRLDSLKMFLNDPDIEVRQAAEFGIAWHLFDVENLIAVSYANDRQFGTEAITTDSRKRGSKLIMN